MQNMFLSHSTHTVVCMVDILAIILNIPSKELKHLKTNPDMMVVIQEPLPVVTICFTN